jgi:hypothetical protein
MPRREPNYIALGCAAAFLLSFLFLPFYRVVVVSLNGWTLLQFYVIFSLPLIAGILMALSSVLMDVRVSIGIGAASLVLVFILLLTGRDILLSGNAIAGLAASYLSQSAGFNIAAVLPLSIGVGGIFDILLAAGFITVEAVMSSRKASPSSKPDDLEW